MDNNVIDFQSYLDKQNKGSILRPQNKQQYLDSCKAELDQGDYEFLLLGIMDVEYYKNMDEDIKQLIEGYFDYEY